jgi:hypothetical protein
MGITLVPALLTELLNGKFESDLLEMRLSLLIVVSKVKQIQRFLHIRIESFITSRTRVKQDQILETFRGRVLMLYADVLSGRMNCLDPSSQEGLFPGLLEEMHRTMRHLCGPCAAKNCS